MRACSSASRGRPSSDFHEGDVGRRVQRGDFDAVVATDRDLSLRARERFLDPTLAREPEAARELQLGSLARGPFGALEARGLLDLRFHFRDGRETRALHGSEGQRLEPSLIVVELAVQRGRAHGGVVAFASDRIDAELGDREPESRRGRR